MCIVCTWPCTLALSDARGCAAQETSYGVLRPPLGSVRLTVIELVAVLLRAGSEAAERAIMASSAVQEVLQVFLRFPFNSILHHQASSRAPHSLSCLQQCRPGRALGAQSPLLCHWLLQICMSHAEGCWVDSRWAS